MICRTCDSIYKENLQLMDKYILKRYVSTAIKIKYHHLNNIEYILTQQDYCVTLILWLLLVFSIYFENINLYTVPDGATISFALCNRTTFVPMLSTSRITSLGSVLVGTRSDPICVDPKKRPNLPTPEYIKDRLMFWQKRTWN